MQNIGEKLEEARKRQGITIREAAEATKIRADFLIDFENNNFHQSLPEIYKRGFLKLYAKYLGLESDKMINDFNAGQLGVVAPANKKGGNLGVMEVDKSNYQSHYTSSADNDSQESDKIQLDKSLYIKIGAVAGIVLVVVIFITILTSYFTNNQGSSGASQTVSTTTAAATTEKKPEAKPSTQAETSITLVAVGDCFITVQGASDRNIFYTSSLSMGERVPVKINGSVYIISDAMENIQVEKGGATYSAPGTGVGKFLLE